MVASAGQKGVSAALGSLACATTLTAPAGVEGVAGVAGRLPLEWVVPHEVGAEGKSFPFDGVTFALSLSHCPSQIAGRERPDTPPHLHFTETASM